MHKTFENPDSITRHVSDRHEGEDEIPGWAYRRKDSPSLGSQLAVTRRRLEERDMEPNLSDRFRDSLRRTGYPLHGVHCWCDEETMVLTGTVVRYFHAQVVVETALHLAGGRRIENRVTVLPTPRPNHRDG